MVYSTSNMKDVCLNLATQVTHQTHLYSININIISIIVLLGTPYSVKSDDFPVSHPYAS